MTPPEHLAHVVLLCAERTLADARDIADTDPTRAREQVQASLALLTAADTHLAYSEARLAGQVELELLLG